MDRVQETPSASSLEDQLRNMIVSNAPPDSQLPPQHHGNNQRYQRQSGEPVNRTYHALLPNHPHRGHSNGAQHPPPMSGVPSPGPVRSSQGPQQTQQGRGIPQERRPAFEQFVAQHTPTTQAVSQPNTYRQAISPHQVNNRYDPHSFHRDSRQVLQGQQSYQGRQLFQAHSQQPHHVYAQGQFNDTQSRYLQQIAEQEVSRVEMTKHELEQKDSFRVKLESICQGITSADPIKALPALALRQFGSLASGFATQDSDMDLAIVTSSSMQLDEQLSLHEDSLPRMLEKALLDQGHGARLLSRTRVPIIKICEDPTPELLNALRQERAKWDALTGDEKYNNEKPPVVEPQAVAKTVDDMALEVLVGAGTAAMDTANSADAALPQESLGVVSPENVHETMSGQPKPAVQQENKSRNRPFTREKAKGPLDFPKQGVGIQCDINFFNPLGIHNTQMLRCYSLCDPRVRPMVLFIKAWAKRRKINHPYSGTLSSYGYVLMVLHYLVNIVRPAVLPNLQLEAQQAGAAALTVDGWEVCFWGDEQEISKLAEQGRLTQNKEPLGSLLKGFFRYYSTPGNHGFVWTQDVLSLRTPGGLVSKGYKGWTGAKTETTDTKEVRHRYLFAIEDPFELKHNVARTVTHPGICAIRDEFRRVWRILTAIGFGQTPNDGPLFAELIDDGQPETRPGAPIALGPPTTPGPPKPVQQPSQPPQVSRASADADALMERALAHTGKQRKKKAPAVAASADGQISGAKAKAHLQAFAAKKNGTDSS